MNRKKLTVYVAVPIAMTLALIGGYFSGIGWLQQIVAPEISWMDSNSGRELGLLENLQNVALLAAIGVLLYGIKIKSSRLEKYVLAVGALGFLFLLLEEIDYGLHYYELIFKVNWAHAKQVRNIHNQGDMTDIFKKINDVGIVLFLVLFPLFLAKSSNRLIRYVVPDRHVVLSVIAMFLVSSLAHALKNHGFGTEGPIHQNLSEFRELMIYYVFVIYLIDVVFKRQYTPQQTGENPSENFPSGEVQKETA